MTTLSIQDRANGAGIGFPKLEFCVGSRVKLTRNFSPSNGLYKGSVGTVLGFGFPSGTRIANMVISS
jgi:hypothetical protein